MNRVPVFIFLLITMFLTTGQGFSAYPAEGVDPVPWETTTEPQWVDRSHGWRVYGRTETDVHFLYQGIEAASSVVQSSDFKALASVIVLLGVVFLGLLTFAFRVTVIDLVAYIVSSILVFGLLTSNPTQRILTTSFSPAVNRYLPAQFQSDKFEVGVPFGAAIIFAVTNYIAKTLWDASNAILSRMAGVDYRTYPYRLADGYINILEKFGGLPTALKPVMEHFVNQCVATPLSSEINRIMKLETTETPTPWPSVPQSVLSKMDLRAALEKAGGSKVLIPPGILPSGLSVPGVDPDSGGITTCKELYHSIVGALNSTLGGDIVSSWNALSNGSYSSPAGPSGNIGQTLKTLGAATHMSSVAIQTFDYTAPAVSTATMMTYLTLSDYLRTNLKNYVTAVNLESGTNVGGTVNSFLKPMWRISKKTAFDIASFIGGVFSELVETIYPMALGLLYFILYLAFPVIIILALLPGNSWWMGILDYMRLLLFAHMIPVALMWGDQFVNILLNTNVISKVVYSSDSIYHGVFGSIIPQDIIDKLIVNANIARGVGNILALLAPFVLYIVIARGSIAGVFTALSTGLSTITAGLATSMGITGTAAGGLAGMQAGAAVGGVTGGPPGAAAGALIGGKIGAMAGGVLGQSVGSGIRGVRF